MSEASLELPTDTVGKVNYDVLGKIITAKLMGEVVCASHVDKKHKDEKKAASSFNADTEWEYSHERKNVVVLQKKTQRTCFMGRGVIDAPLEVVANFVKDIKSYFTYDELLVDARIEKMIKDTESERDYIGYLQFESHRYCGLIRLHRDLLFFARCTYVEGKFVHSGVSIEDPDCPPCSDMPRMFMHMGTGFVAESYDKDPQKTFLSYLAHIDTKGIPSIVNNQVLRKHPMAIAKIRATLERKSGPHFQSESLASASASLSTRLTQQSSRYYEDTAPTKDFMHGFHKSS